jgi:hypothetical protein
LVPFLKSKRRFRLKGRELTKYGLGASHQTGWTGVVAKLIEFFGRIDQAQLLSGGKTAAFGKKEPTRDKQVA